MKKFLQMVGQMDVAYFVRVLVSWVLCFWVPWFRVLWFRVPWFLVSGFRVSGFHRSGLPGSRFPCSGLRGSGIPCSGLPGSRFPGSRVPDCSRSRTENRFRKHNAGVTFRSSANGSFSSLVNGEHEWNQWNTKERRMKQNETWMKHAASAMMISCRSSTLVSVS